MVSALGTDSTKTAMGRKIIFEGNRLYRQEYWASTNKLNYEVIGNIHENLELLGVKE